MKKIIIDHATMNRIAEVARPLLTADNCMSFDFGTGVCSGGGQAPDALISKISITNGCEQAELAIYTGVPDEIPADISAVNPAVKVVVRASEFVTVVDALAAYEQQFEVEINESSIMLSVGSSQIPVARVANDQMKALVPHKMNSTAVESFDKDLINLRIFGKDLLTAVKAAGAFTRRIGESAYSYYNVSVKDIKPVMAEVEAQGVKKTVCRYNCQLQFVSTDTVSFASGSCRAIAIKGLPEEQYRQLTAQMTEKAKATYGKIVNPVVHFTVKKDENEKDIVEPIVQSYSDVKANFDAGRELALTEDEFQFGIPVTSLDCLVKLAAAVPDAYVEITIGEKYIYAFLQGMQTIFLCPQKQLHKTSFAALYRNSVAAVVKKKCNVSLDGKGVTNALRLCNVYEKDALVSQMPVELCVTEKEVEIKRGEAKSVVSCISAETSMDTITYGVNGVYLTSVLSALPSGNVRLTYGLQEPMLVFNAGGEEVSPYGTGMLVLGVKDVESNKAKIREEYEKSLEEKKKKEEKKEAKAE